MGIGDRNNRARRRRPSRARMPDPAYRAGGRGLDSHECRHPTAPAGIAFPSSRSADSTASYAGRCRSSQLAVSWTQLCGLASPTLRRSPRTKHPFYCDIQDVSTFRHKVEYPWQRHSRISTTSWGASAPASISSRFDNGGRISFVSLCRPVRRHRRLSTRFRKCRRKVCVLC
jgi:hypothetical protein